MTIAIIIGALLACVGLAWWLGKDDSCPECDGTLFTWSYGKLKCNRDGRANVTHRIY